MPAPLRHPAQVGRPGSNPASEVGLLYIPPATCFIPTQVNIYTGNGSIPVPGWNSAGAGARNANVSGLITGNWLIGHRQLVSSSDNYTHVLLLDPSIEIRDPYTGIGQAPGSAPDAIEVLSEGVTAIKSGWRFVVMSGVADIPGLGRRKIVFLDQRSTYPTSTMAKDTFTDANTAELTSHVPDAGATAGWQFATGDINIDNQGRAQIKPGSAADARALINIGQSWFSSGTCDVYVQPEPAAAGVFIRGDTGNNGWDYRLSTTKLRIIRVAAGVDNIIGEQNVSLTTGTKHTLTFSVTLGSDNHSVKVDNSAPLNVPSQSFNNTKTTHGIVLKYDAGGGVYGGPVDNFQIQ